MIFLNILFIGDIVGSPGRKMVQQYLPQLKDKYRPHLTIVNGENAAGGKGITEKIYKQFLNLGVNAVTMGNHTWDKREIFEFIDDAPYLVRPANFPEDTPGQGIVYVAINGVDVAIINLQGRTFMPPLDDPFKKVDQLVEEARKRTPIIFIDFHAEATSEKIALGYYVNGRASVVVGTHTHVQTADERILSDGTAYLTDAGMTGPNDGVLGVEKEAVLNRFLTSLPVRFDVEKQGQAQLSGCFVRVDKQTGKAIHIERILINENHPFFS